MNKVLLLGRLVKDPELRYTQSGTAVVNFTLAVNRRFTNQNGEREADFIDCVAWQKAAEFVANYFHKGQMMALEGRLQVSSYEKDGKRQWKTDVVAEQIDFAGSKSDGSNNSNGGGNNYGSPDNSSSYCNGNDSRDDTGLGIGQEIAFDMADLPF